MEYYDDYLDEYEDDDYLEHHGIKGMKWGIRRFRNYDGTLTAAGKAQRKSSGFGGKVRAVGNKFRSAGRSAAGRVRSVRKNGLSSKTKKRLATAAKVAGAAAAIGGAAYLANRASGGKLSSVASKAVSSAKTQAQNVRDKAAVAKAARYRQKYGTNALPGQRQSMRERVTGAASRARTAVGNSKFGQAAGRASSTVRTKAGNVAGAAKSRVQNARDMHNIRKASKYRRKYGVNALPGQKTGFRERAAGAAGRFRDSAKRRVGNVRDTLDNASRGIDNGTRLGRAASAVGAAGRRVRTGAGNAANAVKGTASNARTRAGSVVQGARDKVAVARAKRYRNKYGVNALGGERESFRSRAASAARKVQGRAATATSGVRTAASTARNRVAGAAGRVRDTATKAYASGVRKVTGGNKLGGERESLRSRVGTAARKAQGRAATATSGVRTAASTARNRVGGAAGRVRDTATKAYASGVRKVTGGNKLGGDRVSLRSRAASAARKVQGRAATATSGVRTAASTARNRVAGAAGRVRDKATSVYANRVRKTNGNRLGTGVSARERLASVARKAQGRAATATSGVRTAASTARNRVGGAAGRVRDTATKAYASGARKINGNKLRSAMKSDTARTYGKAAAAGLGSIAAVAGAAAYQRKKTLNTPEKRARYNATRKKRRR